MPVRPLPRTHLQVDEANRARLVETLGLNADRPVIAFCPGAEYGPAKRWPTEHFAELAGHIGALNHQVWIFGSAKEHALGEAIAAERPSQCVNLAGRTGLADVIDLLSLATAVVSNDSGLMHLAAGLDRPLVALYGSSSPLHTPPLSPKAKLLSLDLDCSPCYARECPLGHFRCLRDLTPDRVLDALDLAATRC